MQNLNISAIVPLSTKAPSLGPSRLLPLERQATLNLAATFRESIGFRLYSRKPSIADGVAGN